MNRINSRGKIPIPPGYSFTEGAIKIAAPRFSGVYVIYNPRTYIFVGESKNIRKRLLEHFQGDNQCILSNNPVYYDYELCSEDRRVQRQRELIDRLKPICNQGAN